MRWQKIARVVVAAIGLAGAVAIYYYTRSRPAPADPPQTLAQLDANVVMATDGCQKLVIRPGKSNAKIECAASELLSDGRIRMKQVVISGLNGSAFVMRGDLLESAGQTSTQGFPAQTVLTGHTKLTTDDGLELLSDRATYDDVQGEFVMPGAVTFTRGRLSGTSLGATYQRDADIIQLLDKASARVAADPSGKGTANATATRMSLKRGQHTLQMAGNVRVVGDTQTMTGNDATWTFTENEQAVKYVELRGAARVFPNVRGNTDQATMNGDNITMTFGPDGLTLQHATLTGSAGLEMAGSAPRTIRASLIDFFLGPDGRLVSKLDAKDQVSVTLAATSTASGRTITATTLAATGDDTKGLTRAQFDGNPVFRQDAAAIPSRGSASGSTTGKGREGSATRLVLTLGGQIDAIQFAEFQQDAKFDDADMHGEGDIAKYDEANQRLYLMPNDRDPRRTSLVRTADMEVTAWTIDVRTESQDLTAKGAVRTRTFQKASAAATASLFSAKDAILGAAESFTYTKSSRRAVYTGTTATSARLWQGEPKVEAEEIVYFDETQSLTASRRVDSTWELDPGAGDKPGTPVKTYKVRADTLDYDDARRTAVYNGATVYLNSSDGDVEARKMTFQLAKASRTLEQMRAEQDVYAQLPGGYEASGEVLVFQADQDVYKLSGMPGRNARLKRPADRTDSNATTAPQCTLSESMQINLNRRTNGVEQPTSGEAPKPNQPIGCTDSIRRSK